MAGNKPKRELPDSDITLITEEGLNEYGEENTTLKIESDIEKIRDKVLSIDFNLVPFSEHDIKNIISKEVLSLLLKSYINNEIIADEILFKEYLKKQNEPKLTLEENDIWENRNVTDLELNFTIGNVLESKINSDIPEFINNKRDIDEQYKYHNYGLDNLNKCVKKTFSTEIDIDFNKINKGDIIKVLDVARQTKEEIISYNDYFEEYEIKRLNNSYNFFVKNISSKNLNNKDILNLILYIQETFQYFHNKLK